MATPHANNHLTNAELVSRDEEQLRLLGRYHFVVGGLYAIGLLSAGIFVAQHVLPTLSTAPTLLTEKERAEQSSILILMLIRTLAVFMVCLNGWFINKRRYWLTCLILSVLECAMLVVMSDPMSLILGISATLVLRRPAVKILFMPQD